MQSGYVYGLAARSSCYHEQHYSNKLAFEPSGSVTTDNLEKAFTSERVQLFDFILRGFHPLECKDLTIDLDQGGLRRNWASFWMAPRMNRGLSPAFFRRLGGGGGGGGVQDYKKGRIEVSYSQRIYITACFGGHDGGVFFVFNRQYFLF